MGGLRVPGKTPTRGEYFQADWNVVEPGLFRTLKLPLVRGRDFNAADTATSPWVAVVNEALAGEIWPGEDALGKQMTVHDDDGKDRPVTIVGITGNARLIWLTGRIDPYIYVPFAQRYIPERRSYANRPTIASAIPRSGRASNGQSNLPISEAMRLSDSRRSSSQRIAASSPAARHHRRCLPAPVSTASRHLSPANARDRHSCRARRIANVMRPSSTGPGAGRQRDGDRHGRRWRGSTLLELLYGVRGLDPLTFGGAVCSLPSSRSSRATSGTTRDQGRSDGGAGNSSFAVRGSQFAVRGCVPVARSSAPRPETGDQPSRRGRREARAGGVVFPPSPRRRG
jgi:hypothetical protein